MTVTGSVLADEMRADFIADEFERFFTLGCVVGALDAPELIPRGSTVQCIVGRFGFGVQATAWRYERPHQRVSVDSAIKEHDKWMTTEG